MRQFNLLEKLKAGKSLPAFLLLLKNYFLCIEILLYLCYNFYGEKNMNAYLTKLKNFSVDEILASIDKDFYKNITNEREMKQLTKIFIDKFCYEKNLAPALLQFKKMHETVAGAYQDFKLIIDSRLIKGFVLFRKSNNFYYVFDYFNTLLHELRHHEQSLSACKDMHPVVRECAIITKYEEGFEAFTDQSYGCEPCELDARYFSYKKMQNYHFFIPYLKSNYFIDQETSFINKQPMDYVDLLKDEKLRGLKPCAQSIKNLIANVKSIALKNALTFVGIKTTKDKTHHTSWKENLENIKLGGIISEEIAPEFFSEKFLTDLNLKDIEEKVDKEIKAYNDFLSKADLFPYKYIEELKEASKTSENEIETEMHEKEPITEIEFDLIESETD